MIVAIQLVLAFARFCAIGATNESCAEIKFARRKQWRWFISSSLIRVNSPCRKQIFRQNRISVQNRILFALNLSFQLFFLLLRLIRKWIARWNKLLQRRSRSCIYNVTYFLTRLHRFVSKMEWWKQNCGVKSDSDYLYRFCHSVTIDAPA